MNELKQGVLVTAGLLTFVLGCFLGVVVMEIFHFYAKEWFSRHLFGVLTHDSLQADRPAAWTLCWWLPYGVFALVVVGGLWALYFLIPGGAK